VIADVHGEDRTTNGPYGHQEQRQLQTAKGPPQHRHSREARRVVQARRVGCQVLILSGSSPTTWGSRTILG
jgi:hypothetical protein